MWEKPMTVHAVFGSNTGKNGKTSSLPRQKKHKDAIFEVSGLHVGISFGCTYNFLAKILKKNEKNVLSASLEETRTATFEVSGLYVGNKTMTVHAIFG